MYNNNIIICDVLEVETYAGVSEIVYHKEKTNDKSVIQHTLNILPFTQ